MKTNFSLYSTSFDVSSKYLRSHALYRCAHVSIWVVVLQHVIYKQVFLFKYWLINTGHENKQTHWWGWERDWKIVLRLNIIIDQFTYPCITGMNLFTASAEAIGNLLGGIFFNLLNGHAKLPCTTKHWNKGLFALRSKDVQEPRTAVQHWRETSNARKENFTLLYKGIFLSSTREICSRAVSTGDPSRLHLAPCAFGDCHPSSDSSNDLSYYRFKHVSICITWRDGRR